METLDGNAVAGLLYEVFGEEMTTAIITCAGCGVIAAVAEAVVYPSAPGAIIRCRACGRLLMAITEVNDVYCVDLRGIAALQPIPSPGPGPASLGS
jgi:ribosomal protein S27E